jgi:hypothetical protein
VKQLRTIFGLVAFLVGAVRRLGIIASLAFGFSACGTNAVAQQFMEGKDKIPRPEVKIGGLSWPDGNCPYTISKPKKLEYPTNLYIWQILPQQIDRLKRVGGIGTDEIDLDCLNILISDDSLAIGLRMGDPIANYMYAIRLAEASCNDEPYVISMLTLAGRSEPPKILSQYETYRKYWIPEAWLVAGQYLDRCGADVETVLRYFEKSYESGYEPAQAAEGAFVNRPRGDR